LFKSHQNGNQKTKKTRKLKKKLAKGNPRNTFTKTARRLGVAL